MQLSLSLSLSLVSVLLEILNDFLDVGLGSKLPKLARRYDGWRWQIHNTIPQQRRSEPNFVPKTVIM